MRSQEVHITTPARNCKRSASQGDNGTTVDHLQPVVVCVQAQVGHQPPSGKSLRSSGCFFAILVNLTLLAWDSTLRLSVRGSETSVCRHPGRVNEMSEPSKVR